MRVLIATNELQGTDPTDYSYAVEGELVTPLASGECVSEWCDCRRGFSGLASSRGVTTAMVVDHPHITTDDVRDAIRWWLEGCGWTVLLAETGEYEEVIEEIVDEHVERIVRVCAIHAIGSIVERDGQSVRSRSRLAA